MQHAVATVDDSERQAQPSGGRYAVRPHSAAHGRQACALSTTHSEAATTKAESVGQRCSRSADTICAPLALSYHYAFPAPVQSHRPHCGYQPYQSFLSGDCCCGDAMAGSGTVRSLYHRCCATAAVMLNRVKGYTDSSVPVRRTH